MPKGTQRLGRAIARTQPDDGARNFFPEPWESTNIILGDEFGEIQQLYDRRDDTSFLEGLCRALPLEYCGYGSPSGEWKQVHEWHLRTQAIWKNPPATPAELLDRVEYVLSHTTLDSNPGMKVELHEPAWNTV